MWHPTEKKVLQYIQTLPVDFLHSRIIIGVSGGPDSIALLNILYSLKEILKINLIVVHVNHNIRPEAEEDAEFVLNQAKKFFLPFLLYNYNVQNEKLPGETLEEAARRIRYTAFQDALQQKKADFITTAHHADDNAETILLHLLRGSGLKGISGIQPLNGKIVRPLLSLTHKEIIKYIDDKKLLYVIDKTNTDTTYTRNRIRHVLLPLLKEQFNPNISEVLNRLGMLALADEETLDEYTQTVYHELIKPIKNGICLALPKLKTKSVSLQRRIIRKALFSLTNAFDWTFGDIEAIRSLSSSRTNKAIFLKKSLRVEKVYDQLLLSTDQKKETPFFSYLISVPGKLYVPEISALIEIIPLTIDSSKKGLHLAFPKDIVPLELIVRNRQKGDYFKPRGASGGKKLKDWMIDRKIPPNKRNTLPLLVDKNNNILAVSTLKASSIVSPSSDHPHAFILSIKNKE